MRAKGSGEPTEAIAEATNVKAQSGGKRRIWLSRYSMGAVDVNGKESKGNGERRPGQL